MAKAPDPRDIEIARLQREVTMCRERYESQRSLTDDLLIVARG